MSYDITYFKGTARKTRGGKTWSFETFEELADEFSKCAKGAKNAAYFVRGKLKDGVRKDENLENSNLIVIDADCAPNGKNAPDPAEVHNCLVNEKINHFIYTTHSHSADVNKFRVVIAADEHESKDLICNTVKIIGILLEYGCPIKFVKEMKAWSQPWFVPTRENPEDGLYEFYKYVDGNDWRIEYVEENSPETQASEAETASYGSSEAGTETIKEMADHILDGSEYHQSLLNLSYQLVKQQLADGFIEGILTSMLENSTCRNFDPDRMKERDVRIRELPKMISGAHKKIEKEGRFIIRMKDEDVIDLPVLPIPPGLLGELMGNAYDSMRFQYVELALMSAIGIIAGICGRKFNHVHKIGGRATGLNVYMCVVGETGAGKSGMESFCKFVFRKRGTKWSFLGPADFTGPKALVDAMQNKLSMLSVTPEAGILLNSNSGDQEKLMAKKLNLYTQSGIDGISDETQYSNIENNVSDLYSPAYSQLSESTPDVMFESLRKLNAGDKGLLPRHSLFILPDNKKDHNFDAFNALSSEVEHRLDELLSICQEVQCEEKYDPIFVICQEGKMFEESKSICDEFIKVSNNKDINLAERQMSSRMYVKLLKYASLCAVFNNGLSAVKGDILEIDWDSWNWAKEMIAYENKINTIFLAGMAGSEASDKAVKAVEFAIKKLLMGNHPNKKAQAKVSADLRKIMCIPVNVLRDLLLNNKDLRQISSGDKAFSIKSGLEKVLESLERSKRIKLMDKNPVTGRNCQMIKALEAIND